MSGSIEESTDRSWSRGARTESRRVPPISTPSTRVSLVEKRELTTLQTIKAGALAGLVELLIMYPLDVVKTRNQLAVGSGVEGGSVFRSFTGEFLFRASVGRRVSDGGFGVLSLEPGVLTSLPRLPSFAQESFLVSHRLRKPRVPLDCE